MSSAVVVGAGVFGAATARELARRGWEVTLVEQYAPGNVRSGSGGDTRLLRASHGADEWYTRSAWRSRTLWLELQEERGVRIWDQVGVAWLDSGRVDFEDKSEQTLARLGIPAERLDVDAAQHLFPSLGGDDLRSVLFEPDTGVLRARAATQLLADDAARHGACLSPGRATPAQPPAADVVVWACGAWLPHHFPALVDLKITKRDVFFFGVDAAWSGTPGFCDYGAAFYGHGELGGLGMKIAPDGPDEDVDPDTLHRVATPANEEAARAYAALRFPALADAPIVGVRVCQYDLTRDTHFIVAPHPEQSGWWLIGGGSGHGFKHGPALAEYLADCIEGRRTPEPFHALGPRAAGASLRTGTVEG